MAQSQAWRKGDTSDTGRDIVEVKEEEVGSQKQATLVYALPSKPAAEKGNAGRHASTC